ncbi:hypothetical protein SDC9_102604 [bioreactor metagenome]|uniref:Uncharacterized protein n=1 Tax=bioreactor metagenome TaxID=1076179 RepID=A0A645ARW4_9ZZZZ
MPRYKSVHTGPQIDSGVARALPGGEIDAALDSKVEIEFLDNIDFTNPVAQAGIGGMHGSVAYAVDRWKLISGTVSWSSNGLTLNGTIRQIREFSIGFPVVPSIEMHSGTATITYDDTTKYCDIISSGGVIKRPHLGIRGITDWAKIPTLDREITLRKCQKYYYRCSANYATGYAYAGVARFSIPLPVSMRVSSPSIVISGYLICNGSSEAMGSVLSSSGADTAVLTLSMNSGLASTFPLCAQPTSVEVIADLEGA